MSRRQPETALADAYRELTKLNREPPRGASRVVFLDGMRGWASLMVLLSHLVLFFLGDAVPGLQGWWFGFASDGNFAIVIFFVLSGFALSTGYIQSGDFSTLVELALRRYLRLAIPILGGSLLVFLAMYGGLLFNIEAGQLQQNDWTLGLFRFPASLWGCVEFALYDVFFRYDRDASYNPVLWTMSYELFGSYVVLSICALMMGLRLRVLMLGLVLAGLAAERSFWYLPFVCGVGIAMFHHWHGPGIRKLARLAWPFVMALVVYYSASVARGGLWGLPPIQRSDALDIVAASAMVLAASCAPPFRAFLENALSRYLGSISFPLYLTHLLVIGSFSSFLYLWLQRFGLAAETVNSINFVCSMLVCILVAHAFRHVERFSIVSARRFSSWAMRPASARM